VLLILLPVLMLASCMKVSIYEVTFIDENEEVIKSVFIDFDKWSDNHDYDIDFDKTGYHFYMWSTEINHEDKTIIAKVTFEPNEYNVELDVNGGDPLDVNVISVTYDEKISLLPNLITRGGYTFLGWKDHGGNFYSSDTIYE